MHSSSWRMIRTGCLAAFLFATNAITNLHAGDSQTIYLDNGNPLPTVYSGPNALVQALGSPSALPLSAASDDFDHDGVADLAVGYSTSAGGVVVVRRGNLNAFAPKDQASFEAIAKSRFPSPFLTNATAISVPDRPDFLATGSFGSDSNTDLILASRGGSALYVMFGDGQLGFELGQTIPTAGPISALGVLSGDANEPYAQVFVGVRTTAGPQILVYRSSADGLKLAQPLR